MGDFSTLSDKELLESAPHDSRKIAELISRYMKTVFSCAKRYSQSADYDELVSDGMQALLSAIESFDGKKGEFSAYAAVCVNNRLKNTAKRSANRQKRLAAEEELIALADKSPTPEERVIARESREDMQKSLRSELSELELRCIEGAAMGMSYSEISKRLGVDKKAVDNALSRARAKLRKKMSE